MQSEASLGEWIFSYIYQKCTYFELPDFECNIYTLDKRLCSDPIVPVFIMCKRKKL